MDSRVWELESRIRQIEAELAGLRRWRDKYDREQFDRVIRRSQIETAVAVLLMWAVTAVFLGLAIRMAASS